LLAVILLHLAAVILVELRERTGLISAMITGEKVCDKKPIDLEG
jgi:cytochrome b